MVWPEQKYVRVSSYEWVFKRCKGDKWIVSRVDNQSRNYDAINDLQRAGTIMVISSISEAVGYCRIAIVKFLSVFTSSRPLIS